MLTKSDLEQIRHIVREEIENEVTVAKDDIQTDLTMSKVLIQENIDQVKDRVKNIEIKTTRMHKELKGEIRLVTNFLDKENVKTLKRVVKIENHLGISS